MHATDDRIDPGYSADRLLTVARGTVAKVKNFWLVSIARNGEASARVVAPIPGIPDERDWTIWVLTSSGSRKVAEIGRDDRVTLGYQHDPDSAYVVLVGHATIIDDRAQISRRWNESWNNVFAAGAEDLDAVFVRVDVDRIELFSLAQKVAPAPFCKRSAALVRDASGNWRAA